MTLRPKNVSMGLLGIFGISVSFAGCCCFSFYGNGINLSVSHSLASFPGSGRPSQALRASSPRGGATGVPGHSALDAQGPIGRKRAGLAYGGSGFWTRAPCQAVVNLCSRALLFQGSASFARPAWA